MDELTTEVRDALVGARGYITQGWCQGALARDAEGHARLPRDPASTSWCVRGALIRAIADADLPATPTRVLATHALFWATSRANLPLRSVSRTNDNPDITKADMIHLLSTAIKMVEAGEVQIPGQTRWT